MKRSRNKWKSSSGHAKKSLGQNFLADGNYIEKIVDALDPRPNETIVEIGPGRGSLTGAIADKCAKLIAIEIDRDLIPELKENFKDSQNLFFLENDVLEVDFHLLLNLQARPPETKLVANLPYYISTAILQHLIRYRGLFAEIVVMLQKEVVERILAAPGNSSRGYLTVLIEAYFDREKLFDVPRTAFRPVPKVTSAVLRLRPKAQIRVDETYERLFQKIASAAFRQKRKTLANNLKDAGETERKMIEIGGGISHVLNLAGISPNERAEAVSEDEWRLLIEAIAQSKPD